MRPPIHTFPGFATLPCKVLQHDVRWPHDFDQHAAIDFDSIQSIYFYLAVRDKVLPRLVTDSGFDRGIPRGYITGYSRGPWLVYDFDLGRVAYKKNEFIVEARGVWNGVYRLDSRGKLVMCFSFVQPHKDDGLATAWADMLDAAGNYRAPGEPQAKILADTLKARGWAPEIITAYFGESKEVLLDVARAIEDSDQTVRRAIVYRRLGGDAHV